MPCESNGVETLCSSNHRRRHRENPGKSKGCDRSESRPIPKQGFAGSPVQAAGQEIPSPAPSAKNKTVRPPIGGRRVRSSHTSQARMLRPKSHRSAVSLILSRVLRITPMLGAQIMRESHFIRELHRIHLAPPLQKRSSQPGGQCFESAPRHPNEEPRPSEPRFFSFGRITW